MRVRVSDRLLRRLKNRATLKDSVFHVMRMYMNEGVAHAVSNCPWRTGFLASCIRFIEGDPTIPMVKAGVVMKHRGAKMSVRDIADRRSWSKGFPPHLSVRFIDKDPAQFALDQGYFGGELYGYYNTITKEIVVTRRRKSPLDVDETLAHELWHALQHMHAWPHFSEDEARRMAARAMGGYQPYARFIEFGTRNMRARPFWRPAVWNAFFEMLEEFKKINRGDVSYV